MPPHELNKPNASDRTCGWSRAGVRGTRRGRARLDFDCGCFDAIRRTWRASVYGCSGRDDELDDLVQDVFLEAHRGLGQIRDAGSVKGWLARICVRRAVRRLRRRRLRAFLSLDTLSTTLG